MLAAFARAIHNRKGFHVETHVTFTLRRYRFYRRAEPAPHSGFCRPLFSVLQREAGLTATQFSLLTTLPVAMMGLAALCGPGF
jgi:hypothetical protein